MKKTKAYDAGNPDTKEETPLSRNPKMNPDKLPKLKKKLVNR